MGVLIDDLITRGVSEPYRMFTSRAEYRLLLREDNADLRLTPVGYKLGLVGEGRWRCFNEKREALNTEQARLDRIFVKRAEMTADDLVVLGDNFGREAHAAELLRRPEMNYARLSALSVVGGGNWRSKTMAEEVAEQVELQLEVQAKYKGYIERQQREIDKQAKQEALRLPDDIDYSAVAGLSTEAKQKLEAARPLTLGLASRLEGVTPATISLLLIHMKKRHLRRSTENRTLTAAI